MFLSYVLSFFKKDDTIHGGHYFKENMVLKATLLGRDGEVVEGGRGGGVIPPHILTEKKPLPGSGGAQ